MKRATPVNVERPFEFHELFFSRTDKHGVIESGNGIFSRVAEYPLHEMIGKPHNIIRHPDIPKAVFKLFWDTVQQNRPIGAYVKNMSASGAFYWVFGVAFPTESGYVSLRLKPSSKFFPIVKDLYGVLLAEEKAKGIDHAFNLLVTTLQKLGFESYDQFMAIALAEELQSRDQNLQGYKEERIECEDSFFRNSLDLSEFCQKNYEFVFGSLVACRDLGGKISANSKEILSCFKDLNFLSVNMSIGAERAGEQGLTLNQIATGFKKIAQEIQDSAEVFNQAIERVLGSIANSQFQIGSSRLQIETVRGFLKETVRSKTDLASSDGVEFMSNYKALLDLSVQSSKNVSSDLAVLLSTLVDFSRRSEELLNSITGLEVIRITGKVEVAKLSRQHGDAFTTHIQRMSEFIKRLSSLLTELNGMAKTVVGSVQPSLEKLRQTQTHLAKMEVGSSGEVSSDAA